ncbi:MAG: hypothetical protein GY791_19815 [Alphaproteobacteria bacterium]|nr:hypothetical protein [Alphaproteobacteria bacterium]
MWKWTCAGLLVLLMASNAWWLYQAIDLAVTEKYRQAEKYEQERTTSSLIRISNELVRGYLKQDLIALLRKTHPETDLFEKEGALHIPFLSFPLDKNGRVEGIEP